MDNKDLILQELYEIEPSLKNNEEGLKLLIDKLILNKPNIILDEDFVNNLKRSLNAKAEEMSERSPLSNYFKKFFFIFGGAGLTAILVFGVFNIDPFNYKIEECEVRGARCEDVSTNNKLLEDESTKAIEEEVQDIEIEKVNTVQKKEFVKPIERSVPLQAPEVLNEEELDMAPAMILEDEPVINAESSTGLAEEASLKMAIPYGGALNDSLFADTYYEDLRNKCLNDCCLESVKIMEENGYLISPEEGCAQTQKSNKSDCDGSLVWCENL